MKNLINTGTSPAQNSKVLPAGILLQFATVRSKSLAPRFAGHCKARHLSASVALAAEKATAKKANTIEGVALAVVLALTAFLFSSCAASSLTCRSESRFETAAPAVAAKAVCHE